MNENKGENSSVVFCELFIILKYYLWKCNLIEIFWVQGKHGHLRPTVSDFSWWELCSEQQRDPGRGEYQPILTHLLNLKP